MKDDECPSKKWHDYRIVAETSSGQRERCNFCGHEVCYPKKGLNNVKYLKDHARDFFQHVGRTADEFIRVYGEKKAKENQKLIDQKNNKVDWDLIKYETKEYLRYWEKKSHAGFTDKEIISQIKNAKS